MVRNAMQLHQAGRIPEAANLYQQILRANPRQYEALYGLGFILNQMGHLEQAERLLEGANIVRPREFEPWHARGGALYRLGRHADALRCFDHALSINPMHVEALTNRAVILLEMGKPEHALVSCDTALAFAPDFASAQINRGNALAALKRYDEAIATYDAVLAKDPNNTPARENRENTLFQAGRASRCPPGYMQRLFDDFSADYDTRMVEGLIYRAHKHLRTLYDRIVPDAKAPLNILDLGSGTGLVGEEFKDLARGGRLDGVDLAPLMIEAARRRGIYDNLTLSDLESHLALRGRLYDLMLAADTMIYLGDLEPTFSGVARNLAPGGLYVFAVEAKEGSGWEQTSANRFRHSLDYLRQEAERAGLEFVDYMDCTLRQEEKAPVPGFTVALRKA
jgi:predicted TPR repeat methyltransferase